MGIRIMSHKYGCQKSNSIELIRGLSKKGHCQLGRYPRKWYLHNQKENAKWENCTILIHPLGHELIQHFSFNFRRCTTSLMLSFLISSLYSEPGWQLMLLISFHRRTKNKKSKKTNKQQWKKNKRKGKKQGQWKKEVRWSHCCLGTIPKNSFETDDSQNMVKWPHEFTSGVN